MFIDEVGSQEQFAQLSSNMEKEGFLGDKAVCFIGANHLHPSFEELNSPDPNKKPSERKPNENIQSNKG